MALARHDKTLRKEAGMKATRGDIASKSTACEMDAEFARSCESPPPDTGPSRRTADFECARVLASLLAI